MIHQCEAGEACFGGGACDRREPARRVVSPAEPRDLKHERELGRTHALLARRLPTAGRVPGLDRVLLVAAGGRAQHEVPAFGRYSRGHVGQAAQLRVEDRSWHGAVARSVALAACCRFGLEDHGHGGQTRLSRQRQVAEPALGVEAKGVHDCGQPPARPGGDDLVQ